MKPLTKALIDGFIQFDGWPVSRKSALLYGLALPFHVVSTIWVLLLIEKYPWVDLELLKTVYWAWNLELGFAFVVSLIVARLGYNGYWTLWLNAIPYYFLMVVAISLFGFGNIAFAAWVPCLLVLVTVWYGLRDGLISVLYMFSLILGYLFLLQLDLIPYAPALLDRSIDAQSDLAWMFHVYFVTLLYFLFCFVLVMLLISAKAVQQQRLDEARQLLSGSNRLISRYVPSQLAERILGDEHVEYFPPERAKITTFFSDIEGFTEASDKLEPEELAAVLQDYMSAMAEIAGAYGSSINQFVGDAIMIFFGGPQQTEHAEHALHAVEMACDMQRRIQDLQAGWNERGMSRPLRARMGIHTGYASVGDFGSSDRKAYTAIGVQVNIAARIQARCEPGKVLISQATWAFLQDRIPCVPRGELTLKGVHYPMQVYEVCDVDMEQPEAAVPVPARVLRPIAS